MKKSIEQQNDGRVEDSPSIITNLRSGFGLLSTIPVKTMGLSIAERMYLFPIIGGVLGLLIGGGFVVISMVLPPALTAFTTLTLIYLLCGFNHLDGLADFGDGAMVHGDSKRKLSAMKDTIVGVGGVGTIMIYLIGMYSAVYILSTWVPNGEGIRGVLIVGGILLSSEVAAKHAMVVCAALGSPLGEGMGNMFVKKTGMSQAALSLLIASLIAFMVAGVGGLIAIAGGFAGGGIVAWRARVHFNGINGDVMGAANEVGRLTALICVIAFANILQEGIAWTPW
ncbi:MAG: adenosylcobinamide-GDP ribazoletransferase [Methermicoccaceae archaeon]